MNGLQLNIKTCPVYGDKRYKTYFGIETCRGNCFVCSRDFNKVSFIYEYRDRIWSDGLKFCSDLLKDQGGRPKRKSLISIESNEVKLPNSHPLPLSTSENLKYLVNRGLDDDITRYLQHRLCKFGYHNYVDEDGKEKIRDFSNRIIIPVYDIYGSSKTF